jgi:hypothetical protein
VGAGGEVVAEVAEGVLDGAERLVIGEVNECVGHALQDALGLGPQGLEELLTAFFSPLRGLVSVRRGFVQHGDLPGVRSTVGRWRWGIFTRPPKSTKRPSISHLLSHSTPVIDEWR